MKPSNQPNTEASTTTAPAIWTKRDIDGVLDGIPNREVATGIIVVFVGRKLTHFVDLHNPGKRHALPHAEFAREFLAIEVQQ